MKCTPVVPAIIPKSREHLLQSLTSVSFSNEVQIDLVDGKFDDNITWPYEPVGDPLEVKYLTDNFSLEVDLMVNDPLPAAQAWIEIGAQMIVFHIKTLSLEELEIFVGKHRKVTFGVSTHGDTNIETLKTYARHADYIQLMGIREIGSQGQPFDESTIDKIVELRREFPDKVISVDGSVNEKTIKRLKDAGTNRFIVGSAIVAQPDPEVAYTKLNELINA